MVYCFGDMMTRAVELVLKTSAGVPLPGEYDENL